MKESREQIEVDADWFDRKVSQRKDYLEVHPRGMARLEVLEELAMFERASNRLRDLLTPNAIVTGAREDATTK